MKRVACLATMWTIALCTSAPVWAADAPPTAPAPAKSDGPVDAAMDMTIKVVEIVGTKVQFRPTANDAWQPLTRDAKLTLGSEIRTGPGSSVKLQIGPNAEVILRRLGIINIASLAMDAGKGTVQTLIGKKYGTLEAQVNKVADVKNDFKVATPSSVLAVRGTKWGDSEYGETKETRVEYGQVDQSYTSGVFASLFSGDQSNNTYKHPERFFEAETDPDNTSNGDNSSSGTNEKQDPNSGYTGGSSTPPDLVESFKKNDSFQEMIKGNDPGSGTDPGDGP